jgi:glycosyltransferase involved in cell wall biosynthesis
VRVLFVTHSFPRWSGDVAGAFILRLARALEDGGTQVHVLAPASKGLAPQDTIDGVSVHRFRYAPVSWQTLAYTGTMAEQVSHSLRGQIALAGMLLRGTMAVRRDVTTIAPDVVHAHWWFPGGVLAMGTPATLPIVTTLHGSDVRLARRKSLATPLFRRVITKSAAVTAVSSWLADEARAMAPSLHAAVEPMPVNVELFTPGGARHLSRFLFVGRLNAQKGIRVLLEALAASMSNASLDVVGDGPDRASLEARAAALGIGSRLAFHGAQSQEQLVPLYRAATAVVIPSEDEGLGLVAVEAHLCETPVIAFRSGGLTDVVSDGSSGLLTPPGDVRALSAAIDGLLARTDHGAAFGRAGRVAALARFTPAVVAARYRAIYDRVASRAA